MFANAGPSSLISGFSKGLAHEVRKVLPMLAEDELNHCMPERDASMCVLFH